MQSVRTKDSGTLQYDWFFSGDQSDVSYMRDMVTPTLFLSTTQI